VVPFKKAIMDDKAQDPVFQSNSVSKSWHRMEMRYQAFLDRYVLYTKTRDQQCFAYFNTVFAQCVHLFLLLFCRVNGFPVFRWIFTAAALGLFLFRVFYFQGWYIVTYGLFIYLLNLFILFLSPQIDPEDENGDGDDEKALPTSFEDEFRPFVRRLPEFKFWYVVLS